MAWRSDRGVSQRGLVRVFGIPIHIDRSWFVIVLLVTWTLSSGYFPSRYPGLPGMNYWVMGGVAALLLFVCVLLHELGHSLVAKGYGIPVARVTLFIFGGVAQMASEPQRPRVELMIALAGPLVSVVIAIACFYLATTMTVETVGQVVAFAIVKYLAMINTVILVFNLLPGFPLDGGRVLRAALWAWTGSLRRATRMASLVGAGFGIALMALGVWAIVRGSWIGGMWYILLGFFLRNAAHASYQRASA